MKKVAIVCTGGGTRCAFGGGALVALAKEHGITEPNIIIAASGSAGSACYLASHQYAEIEHIWKQHLASWRFFLLFRVWRMMDIDYLVDVILKQLEPFDTETFHKTQTIIRVPLFNVSSRKIEYVNPVGHPMVFDVIRAAKAMPLVYGKRVTIQGVPYVDGAFVTPINDMVAEAVTLGATHVIVIDNHMRGTLYKTLKRWASSLQHSSHIRVQDISVPTLTIADNNDQAWFATTNKKKLTLMFDAGYKAVTTNENLRKFLE